MTSGNGFSLPILIRSRPGWAAAVNLIDVSPNQIGNNFAWGLSGNLSAGDPDSILDVLADDMLIVGGYLPAPQQLRFPFEAPLLLPGRVLFRVRNESGSNRNLHIGLFYTQIEIGKMEWADLMRSRSREGG